MIYFCDGEFFVDVNILILYNFVYNGVIDVLHF